MVEIIRSNTLKQKLWFGPTPKPKQIPNPVFYTLPKSISVPAVAGYTYIGHIWEFYTVLEVDVIVQETLIYRKNEYLPYIKPTPIRPGIPYHPPVVTHNNVVVVPSGTMRLLPKGATTSIIRTTWISFFYEQTKVYMKMVNGKFAGMFDESKESLVEGCYMKDMFKAMGVPLPETVYEGNV